MNYLKPLSSHTFFYTSQNSLPVILMYPLPPKIRVLNSATGMIILGRTSREISKSWVQSYHKWHFKKSVRGLFASSTSWNTILNSQTGPSTDGKTLGTLVLAVSVFTTTNNSFYAYKWLRWHFLFWQHKRNQDVLQLLGFYGRVNKNQECPLEYKLQILC